MTSTPRRPCRPRWSRFGWARFGWARFGWARSGWSRAGGSSETPPPRRDLVTLNNTRAHSEWGTAAIELVLIVPLLLVVLLFVVGLGRMAHARQQLESVAADSARAASLERNTALSANAARTAARQSLGDAGVSCTGLSVAVDLADYTPGGQVKVTVSCTTRLGDLALAGFPGTKTFTATSSVPVETYRSH